MTLRHYISALLIWILAYGSASAIILSLDGEVNIAIPNTFNGVYLDFTDSNDASAYTLSTSGPEPATWDINPFYGGAAVATSNTFLPVLASTTTNSALLNLALGTTVGSSNDYPSSYSGSLDHMGGGSQQFENGTPGYIGFVINFDANPNDYYGWMKLTLNDDGSTGTIHTWAWETSGGSIEVGAVPEPSHAALLCGLGAACFILSRRRIA